MSDTLAGLVEKWRSEYFSEYRALDTNQLATRSRRHADELSASLAAVKREIEALRDKERKNGIGSEEAAYKHWCIGKIEGYTEALEVLSRTAPDAEQGGEG